MSKPRNTSLPQHHYDQGHYGELPFLSLPSGTNTGDTYVYDSGTQTWSAGWPIMAQEDGADEGRVYILDFTGALDVTRVGGRATISGTGGGGSALTVEEQDGSPSVANVDKIKFSGATVTDQGGGDALVTILVSGSGTDEKVKVSSNDTTAEYLFEKLVAGTNVTIFENNDGGDESITIQVESGTISGGSQPVHVRVSRAASQTITTATDTPVSFDTEDADPFGFWSSGTDVVIPAGMAGYYLIGVSAAWDSSSATGYGQVYPFNVTQSKVLRDSRAAASAGFSLGLVADDLWFCDVGDVIRCQVRHTKGSNRDITSASMWLVKVAGPQITGAMNFMIGDGTNVITPGQWGQIRWPYDGTLVRASLMSQISGSIVVDIYGDSWANYPPNSADSITASAKPTLSNQRNSEDTTLSGWTTDFSEGDVYVFNVDSASTVTRVTLELKYTKA